MKISDVLLTGEENALPLSHLANVTGLEPRIVRRMISDERLTGIPILANNRTGYYLPSDRWEKTRCVRSLRHRAAEIEKAADAIERAVF